MAKCVAKNLSIWHFELKDKITFYLQKMTKGYPYVI